MAEKTDQGRWAVMHRLAARRLGEHRALLASMEKDETPPYTRMLVLRTIRQLERDVVVAESRAAGRQPPAHVFHEQQRREHAAMGLRR